MLTTTQLHWLAGILEGEGSFQLARTARKRGKILIPRIELGMTDKDIVQQAAAFMRIKVFRVGRESTKRKPYFRFLVWGHYAAGWMMTLYLLMGTRRRTKIREILSHWKPAPSPPNRVWGNNARYVVVQTQHSKQPTFIR